MIASTASLVILLAVCQDVSTELRYDPLEVQGDVEVHELEFSYGESDRLVPLKLYLPEERNDCITLLFSHGLGGSRDASSYLGKHWAGRGYAVVFMQHAGSDIEVIRSASRRDRISALKEAASWQSAVDRFQDVKATLDHLKALDRSEEFAGRLNLSKVGMSGHSFGAITTQAVSGQSFGKLGPLYTDKRIGAAVAFSPSPPNGFPAANAFADVSIPWLLMTGTKDSSPVRDSVTPESRRQVFEHLPAGGHFFELVLDGAQHMAFSENRLFLRQRNPNHHKAIQALSTAFWDTYLGEDEQAKAWLLGNGPRTLLEEEDLWEHK